MSLIFNKIYEIIVLEKGDDKLYAILMSGTLRSAPKKVDNNGKTIFNPPEDVLLDMGYMPVTYTDVPTDVPKGQHYESHWEQTDTEIVQVWTMVDNPAEPEPELSADEALNIIMGVEE